MQHWSSTTHAEFGHKHNILVSWPLPFDFKLIGYPKLKCKGCYWRAVHLLPQVCSFQSVTPGLKRWKMCNTSATSDVISHQSLLRNTCYTANATFSFFVLDLCRGWPINSESVRNIWDQYVKGSLVMWLCSGSVNNWLNLSLCTGQQGKGCFCMATKGLCQTQELWRSEIQNHTKPLWSLALSQTSVGNMLLSLDCLLADGMSLHLFFLAGCTHGNEIAIGN